MSGGGARLVRMGVLALFWGSSFLWIKLALDGLSPLQITAVRTVLGAAVLLALCWTQRARLPRDRGVWRHLLFAALFGNTLPFVLFGIGERTIDTGVAGVLNATTPLWVLLIGVTIGTDRPISPVRLAGLLLGFLGTVVIFAPWHAGGLASWGALIILAAAISYAVAIVYVARNLAGREVTPIALSAAQILTAAGLSALALPLDGLPAVHLDLRVAVAVGVLGVFGTGLAFALYYRLITDEGATNASTVGYLLPVVSMLLGAAFLHEPLTLRVVAGMLVVLVGVAMTRWTSRPVAAHRPPDLTPDLAGSLPGGAEPVVER